MLADLFVPAPGDTGTYNSLSKMKVFARRSAVHPLVRQTAVKIVEGAPDNDGQFHARLIRDWIEKNTRFLPDPSIAEAFYLPQGVIAEVLTGKVARIDCEDVAMLAAALGMAIGLRARYNVVAFSPKGPYSHVWTDLASPYKRQWTQMDVTRPSQAFFGLPMYRQYTTEV